jgi:RNA polymerase sigma factor (sigma-70 family)
LCHVFLCAHDSVVELNGAMADAELIGAARNGDAAALGALIERHRPGMRAVALALLGWGPDADDAVQDAILIALGRLGDLRDPAAAGPWLRTITRNAARMRLRSAERKTTLDLPPGELPATEPTPEEVLDGHALRDWVHNALGALSEPLQTVVLLRYFTTVSSYEQIAGLCDVPVGTVRSRLSQARAKLTHALRSTAATAHPDASILAARRRREAQDLLSSAEQGRFHATLTAATEPGLLLVGPQGQRARGRDMLAEIMNSDLDAGVRQRLTEVTASRRTTLLECDLLSPPWDPGHCPPAVLWLMSVHNERIQKIRLFHPRPAAL